MAVSEAQKRATAKYEKENYDKVLVRFSKGTKKRIERQSESINSYIIQAVIERLESDEDETLQEPIQTTQNAEIKPKTAKAYKSTKEPKKFGTKEDTTAQQDGNEEEDSSGEKLYPRDFSSPEGCMTNEEMILRDLSPMGKCEYFQQKEGDGRQEGQCEKGTEKEDGLPF